MGSGQCVNIGGDGMFVVRYSVERAGNVYYKIRSVYHRCSHGARASWVIL
jgi:hypothetical protein